MATIRQLILEEINNHFKSDGKTIFINDGNSLNGISTESLYHLKNIYGTKNDDEFLLVQNNSRYDEGGFFSSASTTVKSTVFFEDRIHSKETELNSNGRVNKCSFDMKFYWDQIEKVVLITKEDDRTGLKTYLRFFLKNKAEYVNVWGLYLGYYSKEKFAKIASLINKIIEIHNNFNDDLANDLEAIVDNLWTVYKNTEEYETVLDLIKAEIDINSLKETDLDSYYQVMYIKSSCHYLLDQFELALQTINESIFKTESDAFNIWGSRIFELKADIFNDCENYGTAVKYYEIAISYEEDIDARRETTKLLKSAYLQYMDSFLELEYDERKAIVIDNEIKSSFSDDLVVIDKSNLPNNIIFPLSHPKTQEVYIGHPYIKESYIPFSTYETALFNDRFEEFSFFIQCLGAKSMTIKVIKGNDISSSTNTSTNVDANLGLGRSVIKNNIDVSTENISNSNKQNHSGTSRVRTQRYNPVKKPYIPENLLWYPNESSWHRLYQQRINGNILHHHDIMSSKSSYSINENEKSKLKVAFKNVLIDAKVEINSLMDHTFSQSETIEWEIEIEFESIENLLENNIESEPAKNITDTSSTSNKDEEEYLEEIKFMLEDDGVIDDKERAILERFRERKGISEERAIELERILLSSGNLSEEEKEYVSEFQEILNDGEITEKERRILSRMASRLGISDERVRELEKLN